MLGGCGEDVLTPALVAGVVGMLVRVPSPSIDSPSSIIPGVAFGNRGT